MFMENGSKAIRLSGVLNAELELRRMMDASTCPVLNVGTIGAGYADSSMIPFSMFHNSGVSSANLLETATWILHPAKE